MKINKLVDLSKFTTLNIGGIAKNFYQPQSLDQLKDLTKALDQYYVLGAGSNLLINDKSELEHVIYMGDYEKDMLNIDEEGIITVSSSIKVRKLLTFANNQGYGGAEYLYSLPAMMGGIVAMNAGRGKNFNKSISDYVISVELIENGMLKSVPKKDCGFGYRTSSFLNKNAIIHCIKLKFDEVPVEVGQKRLKQRMKLSISKQPLNLPSAGSVFKKCNSKIMKLMKILPKNKSGLYFSEKTPNWISNGGQGTYEEAMMLIKRARLFHKLLGQSVELEWCIWTNTKLLK